MNTPRELFENRPKITDEAAMQDLLEKTRVVSRVLQARKDGRILGYAWTSEYDCPLMAEILMNGAMPPGYVDKVNQIHESVLNHTDHGLCAYADQPWCSTTPTTASAPTRTSPAPTPTSTSSWCRSTARATG